MHQPDLPVTFLFTDCFAHVFLLYYNSVAVLTTILWKRKRDLGVKSLLSIFNALYTIALFCYIS